MKKRYYNNNTYEWYTEGQSMTRKVGNGVFSGTPSEEKLHEWGFEEYVQPTISEPTKEDKLRQRMYEIQAELQSMDYLTSKYIDGEDMTEYGDWQIKRKALRSEYRELEKDLKYD